MTKRKAKAAPKMITEPDPGSQSPPWATADRSAELDVEGASVALRCIYPGRLVILEKNTLSGTRYDVINGHRIEVDAADAEYLLSLKRKQSNCCGGGQAPADLKYFEEV